MICLGIETSCDETSVAIIDERKILSNIIYSQKIHHEYGGVVPELASREHIKKIVPTFDKALIEANTRLSDVDCIAVTKGPGLMGSLLIGVCFAKGISFTENIPLVGVNHIEGHIFSHFFSGELTPPFLILVVSGGHTHLYEVQELGIYRLLGRTRDDAAGEAYDKVAKALNLGYPGGPVIDKLAKQGNPGFVDFPRAMLKQDNLDFSFSGIKTAVVYYLDELKDDNVFSNLNHILASFQEAVIDSLLGKVVMGIEQTGIKKVLFSGGVAANSRLREKINDYAKDNGILVVFPPKELCTDNAAMTAAAGLFRFKRGEIASPFVTADPRLKLDF
ncbi:tRNA (adenosine(37)-N6)-threonylcarbamoyltransferase complex transferase subunit TsaD [bacterium]|nr:tRNA (adenosine(37)-N6)-threonylcarbamoyltransferase complex transferase subunit TsaD [bacterium]